MDLKTHAKHALQFSRQMTESVLKSFETQEHWFYQSHPTANHAMWIVGHLGLADNMFACKFRPDGDRKPEGWDELFWFGTEVKSDPGIYPNSDDVLAYLRERRENLYAVLEDLSEEELAGPAPPPDEPGPLAGAPCVGHLFLFAAFHEGVHTGQLTVAHRGLGNPPLFTPKS